jgi:ComF family protein
LSRSAETCWHCHRHTLALTQIRAAVVFEKPITSAIYALKYKNQFGLAEPLGNILTTAWAQWQTDTDIIIPIPLSDERQRQRGYNQSELIAEHFAKQINRPMGVAALARVKHTKPQVGLNMDERLLNVDQAFIADRNLVAGKRVLLIDDVCTTGATLTAAATALLQADARCVSAYCVARAVTGRYKS